MELRYCEHCGDIIRTEGPASAEALEVGFVCDACRAKGETGQVEKPAQPDAEAAEAQPDTGAVPDAGAMADALPSADEVATAGTGFSLDSLNLFSSDTIAARKAEIQCQTSIRLHDPDEAEAADESEMGAEIPTQTEELPAQDSSWEESAAPAEPKADLWAGATTEGGDPAGSAVRASSARKVQFRCLHCPAILAVRPVDTVSKITCPRCGNALYMGPQGNVVRSLKEIVQAAAPVPDEDDEGALAPPSPDEDLDLPAGLTEFLRQTDSEQGSSVGFAGGASRALLLAALLWGPAFAGVYVLNWGLPVETPVSLEQVGNYVTQGLAKAIQEILSLVGRTVSTIGL
ncbi:MAG: hypothetical protein JXP34_07225 [Planctomycetes bacterium]|nr:hypothetical protein [Planctomycetota bacterium]